MTSHEKNMRHLASLNPDLVAWDADRAAFDAIGGWQTAPEPCSQLDVMVSPHGLMDYCGNCGHYPAAHVR